MKNLHLVYDFQDAALHSNEDNLLCEISDNGMSIMRYHQANQSIAGLSVCQFQDKGGGNLQQLIQQFVSNIALNNIKICFNTSDYFLIPLQHHQAHLNRSMLELAFGDQQYKKACHDLLIASNMINVYSIPEVFEKEINDAIPSSMNFSHSVSSLLTKHVEGNRIHVIFFYDKVHLTIHQNGQLCLSRHYPMQEPNDILYNIINACHHFGFSLQDNDLLLSGLINADNPLFLLLCDYFSSVMVTEHKDWKTSLNGMNELPTHYFSHLISLVS